MSHIFQIVSNTCYHKRSYSPVSIHPIIETF